MYDVKRGDILISTKAHSCKVKFVEESNEGMILLVDGVQDESYERHDFFNRIMDKKYKLLCKKEDRKDL